MGCRGCSKKAKRLVRGAIGYTKAKLHIDRASDSAIASRKRTCGACQYSSKNSMGRFTIKSVCSLCTCPIEEKSKVKSAKCDAGKW